MSTILLLKNTIFIFDLFSLFASLSFIANQHEDHCYTLRNINIPIKSNMFGDCRFLNSIDISQIITEGKNLTGVILGAYAGLLIYSRKRYYLECNQIRVLSLKAKAAIKPKLRNTLLNLIAYCTVENSL